MAAKSRFTAKLVSCQPMKKCWFSNIDFAHGLKDVGLFSIWYCSLSFRWEETEIKIIPSLCSKTFYNVRSHKI